VLPYHQQSHQLSACSIGDVWCAANPQHNSTRHKAITSKHAAAANAKPEQPQVTITAPSHISAMYIIFRLINCQLHFTSAVAEGWIVVYCLHYMVRCTPSGKKKRQNTTINNYVWGNAQGFAIYNCVLTRWPWQHVHPTIGTKSHSNHLFHVKFKISLFHVKWIRDHQNKMNKAREKWAACISSCSGATWTNE
jgi:hypothetical protein